MERLSRLGPLGVIVTAPTDLPGLDFVSRFFAPRAGVPEDPVTGSAHTTLTPYWAKRLGKDSLSAMQLSERTGKLQCTFLGDRVEIAGEGRLYLIGEIYV
jgi:predicted PhzF superfamily epimerase YddE/YHI9